MLVLAGAGSGKTRVITEKIAYLIGECGISPSRIAAVTFTNKSAQEMKSRVKKLAGAKASRGLRVSTFHRLALNILQKEYTALDYKSGFSVFASADCITVLSELLKVTGERGLDAAESAHWQISQWKNDGIMPEQAILVAEDDRQHGIAKLYGQYQRQLHAYNAFDLDDLILQTAHLSLLLRFGERRGPVVHGGVRHRQLRQPRDHRLELENHLQGALADLRLVRRVRRIELGAARKMFHHGGNDVIVHAATEKARHPRGRRVLLAQRLEVLKGLILRPAVTDRDVGAATGVVSSSSLEEPESPPAL